MLHLPNTVYADYKKKKKKIIFKDYGGFKKV